MPSGFLCEILSCLLSLWRCSVGLNRQSWTKEMSLHISISALLVERSCFRKYDCWPVSILSDCLTALVWFPVGKVLLVLTLWVTLTMPVGFSFLHGTKTVYSDKGSRYTTCNSFLKWQWDKTIFLFVASINLLCQLKWQLPLADFKGGKTACSKIKLHKTANLCASKNCYILQITGFELHWKHNVSIIWRLACEWLEREKKEEQSFVGCPRLYGRLTSSYLLKHAVNLRHVLPDNSVKSICNCILSPFNCWMLWFGLNMYPLDIWVHKKIVFVGVSCTTETPRHFNGKLAKLCTGCLFVCWYCFILKWFAWIESHLWHDYTFKSRRWPIHLAVFVNMLSLTFSKVSILPLCK